MVASKSPTIVSDDTRKLLDKAKIGLMQKADSAFFTTILFSLKFKWDDTCATAYTDGTTLGFNPTFFTSMTVDERIGVLVHEAMHVAYLHMDRLETREQDLFNQAADHVINLQLLAQGFRLPALRLADERFKDMGTEQVYNILLAEKKEGNPTPSNQMQDLRSPEKPEDLVRQVQDILVRARIHSQMAEDKPGTIPADIELYLDQLLNPKLPWTTILRKYLTTYDKHDYSWKKPNKRHFPEYYLPSLYGESLMDLCFAVDISGSETDADFLRFVSEVTGVFRMMKPKKISLIQWDDSIKSVHQIRSLKQLADVKFQGRGGTDIAPVLAWATEHKPKLLIVFTDGEFYMPYEAYTGDVLWLIHDNPTWTAPYGKVIHFTTKD